MHGVRVFVPYPLSNPVPVLEGGHDAGAAPHVRGAGRLHPDPLPDHAGGHPTYELTRTSRKRTRGKVGKDRSGEIELLQGCCVDVLVFLFLAERGKY